MSTSLTVADEINLSPRTENHSGKDVQHRLDMGRSPLVFILEPIEVRASVELVGTHSYTLSFLSLSLPSPSYLFLYLSHSNIAPSLRHAHTGREATESRKRLSGLENVTCELVASLNGSAL